MGDSHVDRQEVRLPLSDIAGLTTILSPFGSVQSSLHSSTPTQVFLSTNLLWLLVYFIAHPEICAWASLLYGE